MNNRLFKIITFILSISISLALLCGCNDVYSIRESDEDSIKLKYEVTLYKKADFSSDIVGKIRSGKTVDYSSTKRVDGVKWYKTEDGWFTLDSNDSADALEDVTAPPVKGHVILSGFASEEMDLLDAASGDATVIGTLPAGTLVEIYQTRDLWAQTTKGWVLFENVYIPGHTGKNAGWCYTLTAYMSCYSEPSFDSTRLTDYKNQQRLKLYEVIDIAGVSWGYTDSGWIYLEDAYIEGEVGDGACRVKVIAKTPLNVRIGPSTEYDVVRALDIGSYVDVIAQVHNGTDYWGFVGDGWIYMGLVEVQEG